MTDEKGRVTRDKVNEGETMQVMNSSAQQQFSINDMFLRTRQSPPDYLANPQQYKHIGISPLPSFQPFSNANTVKRMEIVDVGSCGNTMSGKSDRVLSARNSGLSNFANQMRSLEKLGCIGTPRGAN